MKPPCLLTLDRLLQPVNRAHHEVEKITRAHVTATEIAGNSDAPDFSEITNQGMFVLLVSRFEIMLSDILVYYLQQFPEKMEFRNSPFTTEQVVESTLTRDLLAIKSEKKVTSRMYGDTAEVLDFSLKTLSIDSPAMDATQVDYLVEIKQTRNLLLHNDLVVNETYKDKAGRFARSRKMGDQLRIDTAYVGDSLATIKYLVTNINERLSKKYAGYTRVAALKRLWDYMFHNPAFTPFEDYWDIDMDKDVIRLRENPEAEGRLSSSGRLFLALWRDSFNGVGLDYSGERMSMTRLDPYSREKVAVFLSAACDFGVLANP